MLSGIEIRRAWATPRRLALAAALLLAASARATAAGGCGPGALALPGLSSCVRLAGSARAEAAAAAIVPAAAGARGRAAAFTAARGRVSLDARSPTAYGPVHTHLSVAAGRAR